MGIVETDKGNHIDLFGVTVSRYSRRDICGGGGIAVGHQPYKYHSERQGQIL